MEVAEKDPKTEKDPRGRKPLPNKLKKVTLSVGITVEALKHLKRLCKETGRSAYDLGGQLIASSVTPEEASAK